MFVLASEGFLCLLFVFHVHVLFFLFFCVVMYLCDRLLGKSLLRNDTVVCRVGLGRKTLLNSHAPSPQTTPMEKGRQKKNGVDFCSNDVFAAGEAATFANRWNDVDRIDIYVGGRLPSARNAVTKTRGFCGSVTRINGALYRSTVHVQCDRADADGHPLRGRFVYIEIIAQPNRINRVFTGVICDVMVYQ